MGSGCGESVREKEGGIYWHHCRHEYFGNGEAQLLSPIEGGETFMQKNPGIAFLSKYNRIFIYLAFTCANHGKQFIPSFLFHKKSDFFLSLLEP